MENCIELSKSPEAASPADLPVTIQKSENCFALVDFEHCEAILLGSTDLSGD